ncbi:hypothetical protein FPQ18DRAFT_258715 [Pyronema domesticum]|nr:hypothetical protein FPQ18DRAFT_258715 [Pyronema domesticum]
MESPRAELDSFPNSIVTSLASTPRYENSDPWPSTLLPLSALTPNSATTNAHLSGVVTLLWPYSISEKTLSILLCEPDFRLRAQKGQLRVNFRGAAAEAVESRRVQIGERVELSLLGVELEELQEATQRDVPWTACYGRRLVMRVLRDGEPDTLEVDAPEATVEATQMAMSYDQREEDWYDQEGQAPATPPDTQEVWQTGNLLKRKGDYLEGSPLFLGRLFDEEEVEREIQSRPRKKPKFSTSSYRLVDRTPSPEPEEEDELEEMLDRMEEVQSMGERELLQLTLTGSQSLLQDATFAEMPPPPVPIIHTQTSEASEVEDESDIPDSPSLKPVPSPNLPIVSPFLHRGLSGSDDYTSLDLNDNAAALESIEPIPFPISPLDSLPNPLSMPFLHPIDTSIPPPLQINPTFSPRTTDMGPKNHSPGSTNPNSPIGSGSEKDSLFDELSGSEPPSRHHSKAQTPQRKTKLSLQISPSPAAHSSPKTPHLYLPTPSPKISAAEAGQFPFGGLGLGGLGSGGFGGPLHAESPLRPRDRGMSLAAPTSGGFGTGGMGGYFSGLNSGNGQQRRKSDAPATRRPPALGSPAEIVERNGGSEGFGSFGSFGSFSGSFGSLGEPKTPVGEEFKSGITTSLSDFPPLAFLTWGATVDIIAIISQHSSIGKAESGPKDFFISLRIVDSSQPNGVVVRVFRPHKAALPNVQVGDVVLLRSFKIQSRGRGFIALSTDNSAWAIWREEGDEAVCAGPPVEFGDEEEKYVGEIREWYRGLDEKKREEMEQRPKEDLTAGVKATVE